MLNLVPDFPVEFMLYDDEYFEGVLSVDDGDAVSGRLGSTNWKIFVDKALVEWLNLVLLSIGRPLYPESEDIESWLFNRGSCTWFSMINIDGLELGEMILMSFRKGLIGHGRGLEAGLFEE